MGAGAGPDPFRLRPLVDDHVGPSGVRVLRKDEAMSRRGSWTVYKSAATGRYVTRAEAEADPERTYGVLMGPVKAAAVTVAARYTKGRRTN